MTTMTHESSEPTAGATGLICHAAANVVIMHNSMACHVRSSVSVTLSVISLLWQMTSQPQGMVSSLQATTGLPFCGSSSSK